MSTGATPGRCATVLGGAFVGTALAIFAGASLATAELKQNEVAERLDQAAASTCSIIEGNCVQDPAIEPAPEETDQAADPADVPVSAPADGAPVPETAPTTVAPVGPSKIAIGDSVQLGAAAELEAAGFFVDAEESRAFVRGIDIVQALVDQGQLPDELVIHLGTNGPIRESEMEQLMVLVVDVPKVLLVENDVPKDYEVTNNSLMVNAASSRANVGVLYWNGLAGSCVGDCIYQDGYHLKSTGAAYYTALVTAAFASPDVFA